MLILRASPCVGMNNGSINELSAALQPPTPAEINPGSPAQNVGRRLAGSAPPLFPQLCSFSRLCKTGQEGRQTDSRPCRTDSRGQKSDSRGQKTISRAFQPESRGPQLDSRGRKSVSRSSPTVSRGPRTDSRSCRTDARRTRMASGHALSPLLQD
jgi:hypothetical protein